MDSEKNIESKIEIIKEELPKEYKIIETLVDILKKSSSEEDQQK